MTHERISQELVKNIPISTTNDSLLVRLRQNHGIATAFPALIDNRCVNQVEKSLVLCNPHRDLNPTDFRASMHVEERDTVWTIVLEDP